MYIYIYTYTHTYTNMRHPVSSFGDNVFILGAENRKVSCATAMHTFQRLDCWDDCAVHLSYCQQSSLHNILNC